MAEKAEAVSPARIFARPTADAIWLGPAQESALSQLATPHPVRVLCGPPSSGRTTLLRALSNQLGSKTLVLLLSAPIDSPAALLAEMLRAADLEPWNLSEVDQRNLLTVFVQQRRSQGKRVVLAIDDAENLSAECWEELERLTALNKDGQPALELLVATLSSADGPAVPLADRLRSISPNLDASVITLGWLPQGDVESYVAWRLSQHKLDGLISETALHLISRYTGGRYRAIDLLCQLSLLELRRHADASRVDVSIVEEATKNVKRQSTPSPLDLALSPSPPAGHLLISRERQVVASYDLGDRMMLGRSELNDICLLSPYVSRYHAAILRTGQGYYIANLNSANGIKLNGQFVDGAPLFNNDVLCIGDYRLKVELSRYPADEGQKASTVNVDDTLRIGPQEGTPPSLPLRVVR